MPAAPLAVDGHRDLPGHERVVVAELVAERRAVLVEPVRSRRACRPAPSATGRSRRGRGSLATLDFPSAVKYVGDALRREVGDRRLVAVVERHEAELGVGVAGGLGELHRVGVELGAGLRRGRDAGGLEVVLVVVQAVGVAEQRQRALVAVELGVLQLRRGERRRRVDAGLLHERRRGRRTRGSVQNSPTLSVVNDETTSGALEPPARRAWLILSSVMLPTALTCTLGYFFSKPSMVAWMACHLARRATSRARR